MIETSCTENVVRLSWWEVSVAVQVGARRQIEALRKGLEDKYGADPEDGWMIHAEGACGEMVVAKHLGIYWDFAVNTFKNGADVQDLHVRTRSEHWHELYVRDDDSNGAFVLVTGRCPEFKVIGWFWGWEAKRHPEWKKPHGRRPPAYFVPRSLMKPFPVQELA